MARAELRRGGWSIGRVVCALLLVQGLASAHDFWIQPSLFRAEVKELVTFELRLGVAGDSECFPRSPEHLVRFDSSCTPPGSDTPAPDVRPIVGREGSTPAGLARFAQAGLQRVAYASTATFVELAAPKFESYLRVEGLESIVMERERLGERELPGRELFSRCAVTLVAVGEQPLHYGAPLGLELELVPAQNPTLAKVGDTVTFTLLRSGTPLAGTRVWMHALDSTSIESVGQRTDESGRVTFEIASTNDWLVTAVDMQRAPDDVRTRSEQPADWISRWATLTFTTRGTDRG